ncbi:radical SAM protein [Desulfonema ishimotonii]|uniref:Radical SAM protein n=1 Tax=Desulfonema ishimotonii TaxID=45657 RepID=A0A401FZL2_9BACT|nr:radical SAM protein [Desulfonema ishimotonii]GBC62387.1 radical SAM protein [Desulfonema ishimotonii]
MNIIVLEHPRILSEHHFNDIANTPLWSCLMGGYVGAALQQAGHTVEYTDAASRGWDFPRTLREIMNQNPNMLCVNAVYFWEHTPWLFEMLAQLRFAGFKGHINLFGFFPTLAYPAILHHSAAVDTIAVGEPEHTLCELADGLNRIRHLSRIPGLAFTKRSEIRFSGIRQPEKDPDVFPAPLRCHNPGDTVMILASRGCYNHCTFCPIPPFYNRGALWRGREPEKVVAEMAHWKDQGASDFYFADPNFIGPGKKGRDRAMKMAELIRPLGITFGMETRPDDLTPEVLEALTDAGFKSLLLGVESGSPDLLASLHKSASRNVSAEALQLCRDAGVEPEVGFLMFVPESTLDDLAHNFRFLEENQLLDRLDRTANLLCHRQIVLMGTSGFEKFENQGRLVPSGPVGFQGDVAYRDTRVKWMSELIPHACLSVLRESGKPDSPIHWEACDNAALCQRVNDWLVNLFKDLTDRARNEPFLPSLSSVRAEIDAKLNQLVSEQLTAIR